MMQERIFKIDRELLKRYADASGDQNPIHQDETFAKSVGLPEGQMGNSEVGHMTIGTGRINKQYPVIIEDMLNDGSFATLPEFKK